MRQALLLASILTCAQIEAGATPPTDLDVALSRLEQSSADHPREDNTSIVLQTAPRTEQTATVLPPALLPPVQTVEPKQTKPAAAPLKAPPVLPEKPAVEAQTVWSLDPRQRISEAQSVKEGYEMTSISVQRVLTAAAYPTDADEDAKPVWSQRLPITVPVLYQTRTLRLDEAKVVKAKAVLKKLETLRAKAQEVKAESELALREWNEIMAAGTPVDALLADSPSLPTNQGDTPINRPAKPGFGAGQGISFTVGGN